MEAKAPPVRADAEVDRASGVTQAKVEDYSPFLVHETTGEIEMEGGMVFTVSEDARTDRLLLRRYHHLELRVAGGQKRGDVEDDLNVG